jgi:Ca-activated chloride channel homolog
MNHPRTPRLSLFVIALVAVFSAGLLAQDTLKVDVNLVNVFATVKDERGEFVTDLTAEDFHVYEDDQRQEIRVFEKQNLVQSSIGLLIDTSGSMVDILPFVKKGVREFTHALPTGNNDFFVMSFGSDFKVVHTSSQSQKHLDDSMQSIRAWGTSLMFDALVESMNRVRKSTRPRKALIVFTDGNDNGSNAGYGKVVEEAQSAGVILYFVAIGSRTLMDTHTLESLATVTGGRSLYVSKQEAVLPVLDQIRVELAHQYYLGYYAVRSPGFHHIRIEVPGRNVAITAKTGYVGGE